jgi:formylglycine-generating enzyme required for sulfatase activity
MHGNVWEWTQDCWNGSYAGAPSDGSAWTRGDCDRRVLRGGSWNNFGPGYLRSANRYGSAASYRGSLNGFRVAQDL